MRGVAVKIIFVCVENSCRSQMAEAFARMIGMEAFSAGSNPGKTINAKAIEVMKELDYDLTSHTVNAASEYCNQSFDYVVSMGCGDKCPVLSGKRLDWQIPDPKNMTLDQFREVRDLIYSKVKAIPKN